MRIRSTRPPAFIAAALLTATVAAAQGKGVWETRPSLAIPRQEVAAAVLDGRVYVAGGLGRDTSALSSVERFDPSTNRWTRVADLPVTLHHFGLAALGGKLYAIGGYTRSFSTHSAAVFSYDPSNDRWSTVAPLPRRRGSPVATTIGNRIYVVGGVVPGAGVVGDLTAYDPTTDRWTTLASMPTPREHLAAAAVGGELWVAGGRAGANFAMLESYDPTLDRWRRHADMPTARGGNGGAELFGRLVVVGGEGSRIFPEAEEYDPRTDTWRTLTPMTIGLHGIYPVRVGDEIWVPGGGTVPGFGATDAVLAFRFRRPTASVRVTPSPVPRSGTITLAAGVANPGRTRAVDVYLGFAGPAGLAFYDANLQLRPFPATPRAFRGLVVPEGVSIPPVPIASLSAAPIPAGTYAAFVILTAADAFVDGRVEPGDLLAVSSTSFTVQ